MVVERADFAIEGVFFFLLLLGALVVGFFCVVMDFFQSYAATVDFSRKHGDAEHFCPSKILWV